MPTIRFNLTKADKKSKKKDSSPFLASETEPPVVMSADVNIPAATPTHPTLYLTRSKRAKLGNQQTTMKKKKLPKPAAITTYESDTDEAAVIAEAIERANSERNNKSSRATRNHPTAATFSQGILTTPIGRNKTFRATETDDDDNDEAASNAEAIDSATAERSTTHKVMRIKQEYIPDIQGTHHPSPIRSYQPQTDLFDESDVDDDDQDDDYSVRSDDDRKIPAPTRPKSTRKRQFDDSDVPASSPDASPAKRMRFQTQKQPEIRYKTRQYVRECGSQQINFVGRSDLHTTKSKVRNSSGAPRPAKRAPTYENRSDQSGDIAAQSDPMANPISHFRPRP
ncbi:hypothetical protein MHU86_10980 [Fragilaria crotonensis]|nr:hypothetical protein MHU86_10980 [Fragilaria crotonensis]